VLSWAQHPVFGRNLFQSRYVNLNRTILDPIACLLDLGFQIGWDLAVQSWKGASPTPPLCKVLVLIGLDRTIGNRLQLQTTTVSAVKLPSGFGPPTSVTLYPIFKSDSDAGPAEVLIVAWPARWTIRSLPSSFRLIVNSLFPTLTICPLPPVPPQRSPLWGISPGAVVGCITSAGGTGAAEAPCKGVAAGAVVGCIVPAGGTGAAVGAAGTQAARSILAVNRTDRTRQSLFDILISLKMVILY
jgi:hypothetical protein